VRAPEEIASQPWSGGQEQHRLDEAADEIDHRGLAIDGGIPPAPRNLPRGTAYLGVLP
jgi:hypothetical protein